MEQEIVARLHKDFEGNAHEQDGVEFWYARELQHLLGYDKWSNFEGVIAKAKTACKTAGQKVSDHFADVGKTISMPKGAEKTVPELMLTR